MASFEGGAFVRGRCQAADDGLRLRRRAQTPARRIIGIRPEHVVTGELRSPRRRSRRRSRSSWSSRWGRTRWSGPRSRANPSASVIDGQAQVRAAATRSTIGFDPAAPRCSTRTARCGSDSIDRNRRADRWPGCWALDRRRPGEHRCDMDLPGDGITRAARGRADPRPLLGPQRIRPALDRRARLDASRRSFDLDGPDVDLVLVRARHAWPTVRVERRSWF